MLLPSSIVISQGWGLIDLPLRASNEGLLRPRVARAQKIIRLHPFRCLSDRAASASKKVGLARVETVCETRRTRASLTRGPGGVDDDRSQRYWTSTVMLWVAETRSWSFVAPFTVIWCVPLLTPLNTPEKPF